MTKEEFLLRAVKDGSLTIDEALAKLNESEEQTTVQQPVEKPKTRKEFIDNLIEDFFDHYMEGLDESDEEDPFNWDAIKDYCISIDWNPVYLKNGDYVQAARDNVKDILKWTIKGILNSIENCKQKYQDITEAQFRTECGLFMGEAWVEDDYTISIELKFVGDTAFTHFNLDDYEKCKES